jgi:hypothetical protein
MAGDKKIGLDELLALARTSAAVDGPCACILDPHDEWSRIQASFPEQDMRPVGTLVDDPYVEASFAEFHPDGTRYWSAEAPIALRHYPYNRCTVVRCAQCGRAYLRYVEAGGYYAEPRVRALKPGLVVDAPV